MLWLAHELSLFSKGRVMQKPAMVAVRTLRRLLAQAQGPALTTGNFA
jgi:hypothetical protein